MARNGCSIILNYHSASSDARAAALASELTVSHAVVAIAVRADISTEFGCDLIMKKAKEHFTNSNTGRLQIDILIHNAAVATVRPLGSIQRDEFYNVYNTNVFGPILLTQMCLPHLPFDRSGRIVNISSVGCSLGLAEQTVYGGSKGALEAMTRVWARELAERATVNAISTGFVMSEMWDDTPAHVKSLLARWNSVTPLAAVPPLASAVDAPDAADASTIVANTEREGSTRLGYDWEVAGVVGMLCTADAGWCTGSIIPANGGMRFSY